MAMKELRAHCAELVQFFGALAGFRGYEGSDAVASWLNLAACIHSINYDTSYFDIGADCCGMADEWGERQARLQQSVVTETTRFLYCWAALEAAVTHFVPANSRSSGKIGRLCDFLKRHLKEEDFPAYYLGTLAYVDSRSKLEFGNTSIFKEKTSTLHSTALSEQGVRRVYKIRNQLAHGAFEIPIDSGNGDEGKLYDIKACSRIVLLTLHMLMVAKYPGDSIEVYWKKHLLIGVPFIAYLRSIHVNDVDYLNEIDYDFET